MRNRPDVAILDAIVSQFAIGVSGAAGIRCKEIVEHPVSN